MSSDIYAKPNFSKKVRYNRKVQEDKAEWKEREVDIYESAEALRDDHTDFHSEGGAHTEKPPAAVQRKPFRAAALCLGVLCFLMITGIIFFFIQFTLEKDELQTRYDRLSDSCSQLQGKISDMAVNNNQLQRSYETLSTNHSQLRDEVKQLKDKIEGKRCPEGWTRFRRSCYFKSNEKKSWPDSRSDCRNKGADLVSINNEEEQVSVFVTECGILDVSASDRSRVFLTCCQSASCLDPVTFICPFGLPSAPDLFWATGSPDQRWDQYQYAAAYCNQQGRWTLRNYYSDLKNWICEKQMSCIL
ncbi:C-type lectin domain family 12 member B-like isoform X2 [Siniperca chuatsi]|uniref:C-type lectin domain family 12 member B-like isoform X2 n=1 Tax=Siniperca chuatsi TaxID=119488 RepID=UPI001CE10A0E|nr:C-type lectin domain family 12 member B-like isoform X2 [Siniperca chuatsi]